jgi:hypothetical protein
MNANDAHWNDHRWTESQPRRLCIDFGKVVLHRHCVQCGRDFIADLSSGDRYAVFASAISFHRLENEITNRWLREPCTGSRLPRDDEDRTRKIAEFPVSEPTVPQAEGRLTSRTTPNFSSIGKLYEAEKRPHGGDRSSGHRVHLKTSERMASIPTNGTGAGPILQVVLTTNRRNTRAAADRAEGPSRRKRAGI